MILSENRRLASSGACSSTAHPHRFRIRRRRYAAAPWRWAFAGLDRSAAAAGAGGAVWKTGVTGTAVHWRGLPAAAILIGLPMGDEFVVARGSRAAAARRSASRRPNAANDRRHSRRSRPLEWRRRTNRASRRRRARLPAAIERLTIIFRASTARLELCIARPFVISLARSSGSLAVSSCQRFASRELACRVRI